MLSLDDSGSIFVKAVCFERFRENQNKFDISSLKIFVNKSKMSSETPRIHLCMTKYEAVQFLKEKGEDGQSLLQKFVMSKAPSKEDIHLMFEQVKFHFRKSRGNLVKSV